MSIDRIGMVCRSTAASVRNALLVMMSIAVQCIGGCVTVGEKPTKPEVTITIMLESIPSGADVFAVDQDGNLGAKLGTTPMEYKVGLAAQRAWYDPDHKWFKTIWWWNGHGVRLFGLNLCLTVAMAKGDRAIGTAHKAIYSLSEYHPNGGFIGPELKDRTVHLTVPLMTVEQAMRERELAVQAAALRAKQSQTIDVRHHRDDLEVINSGLDALLKLNALGAFRER